MPLKLSRAEHLRGKALDRIDRHYAARIDAVLGPMASLHLLKRIVVSGELVKDKAEIEARAAEQDAELARIDQERRDLKRAVREAATAAEIQEILAGLE